MRTLLPAFFIGLILVSSPSDGNTLPLPRFVSLRSNEANMRSGPGERYPIQWTYTMKSLPVEITDEYEHWRKVRDSEGTEGWMHKVVLAGTRTGVIIGGAHYLRRNPDDESPPVLQAAQGVLGIVKKCSKDWCMLKIAGREGWMRKSQFWGTYPHETFGD